MSDRQAVPQTPVDQVAAWRKATDDRLLALEQRKAGGSNGLIVPGGSPGTWIDVGSAGSTYSTNWSFFTGLARRPQFTLDADGFTHLRGHITNSVAFGASDPMVNLPSGYHLLGAGSIETFICPCFANPSIGFALVQATTAGLTLVFTSVAWAATNYISLSGISFYTGGQ